MQNVAERYFLRLIFGIWLLAALAIASLSQDAIAAWKVGDPDDQMRLLQVRDWLAGQSWWDITQYRMNAPQGGDMHWSRLVDVPLGILIIMLRPLLGQGMAEQAAASILPLLTLAAALFLYALAARRLFGAWVALVASALILTIMPFTTQMMPMRIDHHGWQLVCFASALWALFDRHGTAWSALVLGLSCALWIEISVEGLPFVAILLGVSALGWIFPTLRPVPARNSQFPVAVTSTALGAFLFYSATESWLEPNHCDALSRVHVSALGAIAAVIVAGNMMARKWPAWQSVYARLGLCAIAAAVGLGVLMAIAPACAGDAFASLDPLVRAYWFDRTPEGLPLWALSTDLVVLPLAYVGAGCIALIGMSFYKKRLPAPDMIRLILLFFCTILVGAFVSRTMVYAMITANLFLATLLVETFMAANKRKTMLGRMALRVTAMLLAMPSLWVPIVISKAAAKEAKAGPASPIFGEDFVAKVRACQKSSAAISLNQLPKSNVMAGLDSNPAILQFTHHLVVASGHHRNQVAMADVIRTFTATPNQAARIIDKRDIDFVVVCDGSYELAAYAQQAPDGMLAQLRAGNVPDWLERKPDIGPFQIFEVDRTLLAAETQPL